MSYAHDQRRKVIREFKRAWGDKWYPHFQNHVAGIRGKLQGTFIGSLQEIMKNMRGE